MADGRLRALAGRSILDSVVTWIDARRWSLIRAALVAVALASSLVLAPRAAMGNRNPTLLVMAIFGAALLALLLRWPTLGLLGVIVGGALAPMSWQGGFNISQIAVAGTLGVWFLEMLVRRESIRLARSITMLPAIAFAVTSILSFGLGQFSWYPFARNAPIEAQLGGLAINLLSVGAFVLVAHLVDDLRKLKLLTWAFIGLGSVYILGRFFRASWADAYFQRGFAAGSMFWTWLVVLLAGQAIVNRQLTPVLRALCGGMALLTLYVAIARATDWRSGWFPPLVGVAVIFTVRYWRQLRFFIPFLALPLYFIVTTSIGQEDWSWATRLDAWLIVLNIAKVSPILGMGFANYYWYTPLFPIRGFAVVFNSHSQIIDVIAQTGILGLASFVWILAAAGWLGLKLIKTAPDGFAAGYVYGALGGLAGTVVAGYLVDWILPFVYNIGMNGFRASVLAWLFLGGLVSIEQLTHRRQGKEPSLPSKGIP